MRNVRNLLFYPYVLGEILSGLVLGKEKSKNIRELPKIVVGIICVILSIFILKSALSFILSPLNDSFSADAKGLEVVEIIISSGDTSWDIQKELAPNHDPRELLFYSAKLNDNKSLGDIKPGQRKLFYKESSK